MASPRSKFRTGERRGTPRRAPGGRPVAGIVAIAFALSPIAAHGQPAEQPQASGRIRISLSVGPRYALGTTDTGEAVGSGADRPVRTLCLATNAAIPGLPVLLVRPATPPRALGASGTATSPTPGRGAARPIPPCPGAADRGGSGITRPPHGAAEAILLVYPE